MWNIWWIQTRDISMWYSKKNNRDTITVRFIINNQYIVPPINYQTYIKKAWHYRISRWQSTKFSGCSDIMLSVCRVCKGCVMNHPSSNASDSGHRDSQLKTIYLSKQARDPTNQLKKTLNILNRSFPPNRPRILVVSCQRREKRTIDATTISRHFEGIFSSHRTGSVTASGDESWLG